MMRYGAITQASFFIYILAQSFLAPLLTGVEVYGSFVAAFAPLMLMAGLFEPVVQKALISFDKENSCSALSLLNQYKVPIFIFYFFGSVGLFFWASYIEWESKIILFVSFYLYTLAILQVSFLYRDSDYKKISVSNFACMFFYFIGLAFVYSFGKSAELLAFSFLLSQLGILFFSFRAASYRGGNYKLPVRFAEMFYSALSWRLSYVLYYSGFFVVLPFFRGEQYIGVMKIIFSALSSARFAYPITVPASLRLVADGKNSLVYGHLAKMYLLFSSFGFCFYLFSGYFYNVFSIDASEVDVWIFVLVPIYLLVPIVMALVEVRVGVFLNIVIAFAFYVALFFMLMFSLMTPMLCLLLVIMVHFVLLFVLYMVKGIK